MTRADLGRIRSEAMATTAQLLREAHASWADTASANLAEAQRHLAEARRHLAAAAQRTTGRVA